VNFSRSFVFFAEKSEKSKKSSDLAKKMFEIFCTTMYNIITNSPCGQLSAWEEHKAGFRTACSLGVHSELANNYVRRDESEF
jgi:hypothetical protein